MKNDLPVKDLRDLIAWLKANPDKATFGTAGVGSPSHIGGVLFQNITGTHFQFVPYRGTAPVIPDLVSGQIDMAILDPITSLPQFRAGQHQDLRRDGEAAHHQRAGHSDQSTRRACPASQVDPWQACGRRRARPRT